MIGVPVLVLAAVAGPLAADSLARPITLEQALTMAEANAPQIIQAEGQRLVSAAGVRSSWAAFIPTFSLSASTSKRLPESGATTRLENGQIVTLASEPWSYNTGLSSTVELFAGGGRLFDLQQARARATSADAGYVAQRFATALLVKQDYFNVLATREAELAAKAQLEQAQQQLSVAVDRLRLRNVTRSDSLRAENQVRSAQVLLLQARTGIAVANASLARAVGSHTPVTAAEADSLDTGPLALGPAELLELAEKGPAVVQAQADLDGARAAKRGAWSVYLPSVTASYSRGGNGAGGHPLPSDADLSYSGALRFSVSLPIFTQLQREQQLVAAQVAERDAVAGLRDAQLAARESLTQSLGAFDAARERVDSQRASLDAAREDVRMQQERYALGRSTLLDVLASQATLDQARLDLIRARYDQRIAKAQLEALVGREL